MKKVTDVLDDLMKIVKMEGTSRKAGMQAREKALLDWIDSNILEVSFDRDVIKTNLTSEEEDFLKYYLAYQIAEQLIEDCGQVKAEGNKISVKVLALAKNVPKNK